ncbi:hypothetical protein [Streptomyces griseofuscus]|uniref:hypothetical protein n=1 Tax=Streptomyces griseofuscus TaxID=146922 RepID=UPI0033CD496C
MHLTPAEIRLAQYGQRTSTWSTATYNDGTEKALHEIALGLKAEVDRLRAELAEEKAAHDPRLRGLLVKSAPDKDLYVLWSTVCDMPGGVFSRETAMEYGFPPSRLDRADATGTSSHCGDGAWDDTGFVAEQLGWLRRDRLGDYAVEYLHGDREAAYALLEPFDDEPAAPAVRSDAV